jgi:hypothetical protein
MIQHNGRPRVRAVIAAAVVVGALAGSVGACGGSSGPTRSEPSADHSAAPSANPPSPDLVQALTTARAATLKYSTNLAAARADGYRIITPMMPDMGVHYLNPDVQGFDINRPAILVYVGRGTATQLGALEWVFPNTPDAPPLPGATYGSFDAACHYADGAFIARDDEAKCEPRHPITNAEFFFWHPKLVTLHVWLWYPNPDGLYHGTNPLIRPYN